MATGAIDETRVPIPRSREDDYTAEMAERRRTFVAERTGTELAHLSHHSVDPATLAGNVENFLGVAQVPIGLAGPLRINGEHARGDFYVPMATTEGTLVASYSRGMRLLSESGGVRTVVTGESMQRAPVFILAHALAAREFGALGRRARPGDHRGGGVHDDASASCRTSGSTRSGRCGTCGSTTRRVTPPGRT